jgi:hypothetical protein
MTLNLNQLQVETFDIGGGADALAGTYVPIVSTDQVPNCDGPTGDC